jgi:hypothetical protein
MGVDRDQILLVKQLLVETIEGMAAWRAEKAARRPGDAERNLGASEDLSALANSLKGLADDDPLWLAYTRVVESDDALRITEWVSEQFRYIGFQRSAPSGREFLQELLQARTRQEAL